MQRTSHLLWNLTIESVFMVELSQLGTVPTQSLYLVIVFWMYDWGKIKNVFCKTEKGAKMDSRRRRRNRGCQKHGTQKLDFQGGKMNSYHTLKIQALVHIIQIQEVNIKPILNSMGQTWPFCFIFVLFTSQYQFQKFKLKKAQMVCLGFEPRATGWHSP